MHSSGARLQTGSHPCDPSSACQSPAHHKPPILPPSAASCTPLVLLPCTPKIGDVDESNSEGEGGWVKGGEVKARRRLHTNKEVCSEMARVAGGKADLAGDVQMGEGLEEGEWWK